MIMGGIGRKSFEDAITFNFDTLEVKKHRNFMFQRSNHLTVKFGEFLLIHGGQVFLNFVNRKILSDFFVYSWSLIIRKRQDLFGKFEVLRSKKILATIVQSCRICASK